MFHQLLIKNKFSIIKICNCFFFSFQLSVLFNRTKPCIHLNGITLSAHTTALMGFWVWFPSENYISLLLIISCPTMPLNIKENIKKKHVYSINCKSTFSSIQRLHLHVFSFHYITYSYSSFPIHMYTHSYYMMTPFSPLYILRMCETMRSTMATLHSWINS